MSETRALNNPTLPCGEKQNHHTQYSVPKARHYFWSRLSETRINRGGSILPHTAFWYSPLRYQNSHRLFFHVGLLRVSPSGAFWMVEQSRLKNKNTPINHSFSKIYTFSNAIKSVLNQKQLKLLHPFTHTLSYSRYWYRRPLFSSVKISEAETSRNSSVSMGGKRCRHRRWQRLW